MKSCLRTLVHLQLLALLWVVPTACEHDDTAESSEPVQATMAFALQAKHQSATRMSDDVTQTGTSYRNLQDVLVISFNKDGKITGTDAPISYFLEGEARHRYDQYQDKERFYFYEHCNFKSGTRSLLFYGRAVPEAGGKAENGSIVPEFGNDFAPNEIKFSLDPIWDSRDDDDKLVAPPAAQAICAYLTSIATATVEGTENSWHKTNNSKLKSLFRNFVNYYDDKTETPVYNILPGSAANVKEWVGAFRQKVNELKFDAGTAEASLQQAILDSIDKDSYLYHMPNYPRTIGLPDGAAVVRWEKEDGEFKPQTQTTTLADINGINRFCYPAELYYYANSKIKTSESAEGKIPAATATTIDWGDVLGEYNKEVVNRDTKAVVMVDPVQYGVACLQTTLLSLGSTVLKDAKDEIVEVNEGYFPVTGIIVAGQRPVGFDFIPKKEVTGEYSDLEACFVYDSKITPGTQISTTTTYKETNTLLLQNGDGEKVKLFVEFENKSGKSFHGNEGIVYPGTRFYLACELELPEKEDDADFRNRIFTRDYITSVNLKLNETSMAKAYNVLPDLLKDRLELGIIVQTDWKLTPTEVPL